MRLRLPTATHLKGMQAGMQLELCYELLCQARNQMWVGHATFARTTQRVAKNLLGGK